MSGFEVVSSPYVPPGVVLMMPRYDPMSWLSESAGHLEFTEDTFGPAPYRLTATGAAERRRALDGLARLLDGLCADFGLDPELAWRGPRRWSTNRQAYVAETRIGLSVINPNTALLITGI